MFNFSGCKCPICQQPFQEGDDIVVCPECGAPYHRECYKKHGGCVFEDRHAPDFEWKPAPGEVPPENVMPNANAAPAGDPAAAAGDAAEPSSDANNSQQSSGSEIPCPRCGAMNPEEDLFCEACGSPLRRPAPSYYNNEAQGSGNPAQGPATYGPNSVPGQDPFNVVGLPPEVQVHPDEELDGIKAHDWAEYLGSNAAWYMLNFKQMQATGHKFAVCFSAFLFGPFYFFYRKMWVPAFSLLAVNLLFTVPEFLQMMMWAELPAVAAISPQMIRTILAVTSTLSLILKFLCGAFAVNLYKNISAKRIKKMMEAGTATPENLRKAGGTSKTALLVSILALIGISYLASFLLLGSSLFSAGAVI